VRQIGRTLDLEKKNAKEFITTDTMMDGNPDGKAHD
jgi:hypothetical protein